MPVTRRSLLGLLSSSTFVLSASPGAAVPDPLPADQPGLRFDQGVASADPQHNAVMLWTRAEPVRASEQVTLLVQVSSDPGFTAIVVDSLLKTGSVADYTVRAYITGLQADTHYYYRFIGPDKSVSRLGRTRTAPAPTQAKDVNLAFVSCQSYEQAYYGAWARMLSDDKAAAEQDQIQFVLHLGDFIYERSWNKREDGSPQSRRVPDFPDGVISEHSRHAVSLADYRHLYKTYLSDPHLQEARARWPFVSIWDDHEFSNDNFQSYSNYGESPIQDAQRKLDSNQAWFEFIPAVLSDLASQPAHNFRPAKLAGDPDAVNTATLDSLCIYRKLNWGKQLDIVLTDTRSYRSAPCLPRHFAKSLGLPLNSVKLVEIADYGSSYNNGNPPSFLPYGDGKTANPAIHRAPGSALGADQRDWFLGSLKESTATWKLWGNALPLLPMRIDLSSVPMSDNEDSLISIDAWAGYPREMNLLISYLLEHEIPGVVSFSGDHHLHGAGTVSAAANSETTSGAAPQPVVADFACAGISSTPFFESIVAALKDGDPKFRELVYTEEAGDLVPVWHMTMLQGVLASYAYAKTGLGGIAKWLGPNEANRGLKYMDCTANGYGLAQFRSDDMQVQLMTVGIPASLSPLRQQFATQRGFAYPPGRPVGTPHSKVPRSTVMPPSLLKEKRCKLRVTTSSPASPVICVSPNLHKLRGRSIITHGKPDTRLAFKIR